MILLMVNAFWQLLAEIKGFANSALDRIEIAGYDDFEAAVTVSREPHEYVLISPSPPLGPLRISIGSLSFGGGMFSRQIPKILRQLVAFPLGVPLLKV